MVVKAVPLGFQSEFGGKKSVGPGENRENPSTWETSALATTRLYAPLVNASSERIILDYITIICIIQRYTRRSLGYLKQSSSENTGNLFSFLYTSTRVPVSVSDVVWK